MKIPYIPEDAPFNGDQRAWLAGFLAGLHSRMSIGGESAAVATGAAPKSRAAPLHILFGTQTGNAEGLATDMAAAARKQGMSPVVAALDDVEMDALAAMKRVIIITSTYGEGEMPDNAQLFWESLSSSSAPRLEETSFAVLALGDTGYDGFCQAGKLIDMRFEQLGATRISARLDCDIDYEDAAAAWSADVLPLVSAIGGDEAASSAVAEATEAPAKEKSQWSRKNPFISTVTTNRVLSGTSSAKDIRHYEFDLDGSGLTYEAGDALGVLPVNDPALVEAIASRLGLGPSSDLREKMVQSLEISTPSRELVADIEKRGVSEELSHLIRHGDREALDAWLWGKDILDLLNLDPALQISEEEFAALLKPLQHRAYSISSSPLAAKGSVHLTIASVRYRSGGRERGGVCSTFLADRVAAGQTAGIFVSPNKAFRPPVDNDAPMIMVGPGTGIAPFRAFLQEREARGAKGRNWLFFGDQKRADDFIYENEIGDMSRSGLLTRLDLAFSRDQAEKIYVQNRMKENGAALFSWLEEGGHFYVCGDATRMARDVDQALHDIISEHGGLTAEAAGAYVGKLKKEKRYLRDVY